MNTRMAALPKRAVARASCPYPLFFGQNRITRTIAHTMPQPNHVMLG